MEGPCIVCVAKVLDAHCLVKGVGFYGSWTFLLPLHSASCTACLAQGVPPPSSSAQTVQTTQATAWV